MGEVLIQGGFPLVVSGMDWSVSGTWNVSREGPGGRFVDSVQRHSIVLTQEGGFLCLTFYGHMQG